METIELLYDIAHYLGLSNIESDIQSIKHRFTQENSSLVLPLVGEFSSGKTTLINSLTDSKKLETATKPTTATIYEVHFGCDTCSATILDENDNVEKVNDIALLKNESLANAKVVTVFDTSTKVPSSTILVDTPGLSSPDPKHKQTLINFLPKADGIFLVTDINQQITRSLTDFIETMKLSMRPIYLILTKSDTKAPQDIEAAKKYICENCKISLTNIAVVSATSGNLDELYSILDDIQKSKNQIIRKVDEQRIKNIANTLLEYIEDLMSASSSDKELDEKIRRSQYELEKINRNIDKLVDSIADDVEENERLISRKFEDTIFSKLNILVTGKSSNFDGEAISMINNTSTLLLNEYKTKIHSLIREKANSKKGTEEAVYLNSINSIDLSAFQISGLSYNLDLNNMGHEYDGWIKTGVIAVAAVGAVAAVAASGGTAATAIASAATVDNVIDVADTVSDVSSIISNEKSASRIEKAVGFATKTIDKYNAIQNAEQQMGPQVGNDKGIIDSMVGLVTDKMMSKPQRVRAIRKYLDSSLSPDFKNCLNGISEKIVSDIRGRLLNEASQIIEQKTESLNQLKSELREKKNIFEQRMCKLSEFRTLLLTI